MPNSAKRAYDKQQKKIAKRIKNKITAKLNLKQKKNS